MKWLRYLYVQVLLGIAFGILTGWLFPAFSPVAKVISDMFINMIRMVIAPIVFFTLVSGIMGAGDLKKVGRVGGKGLIYFEVVTTIAIIIGVFVANIFRPGDGIDPHLIIKPGTAVAQVADKIDWLAFFVHIIPSNIVDAFAKGDIIQILFFGIFFAIALKHSGTVGERLAVTFDNINKVLFKVLHMVMKLSPLGAFGGMAFTIGKFGFGSLAILGKLLLTFYVTSFLFIFLLLNLIAKYYGFNLIKLLGFLKAELLIVLGSSSSESVLGNLMDRLQYAGCDKSVVGLIIPAGYSFNLDGTSIYLSLSIIFLSQVFNIPLSIGQQITIIGVLLITSKGAAGVTGSGFLVLASTLSTIKVIPIEGLALLIGVDRFMSEGRALTNLIGNTVATLVIARSEGAIDMKKYKSMVEKHGYTEE